MPPPLATGHARLAGSAQHLGRQAVEQRAQALAIRLAVWFDLLACPKCHAARLGGDD